MAEEGSKVECKACIVTKLQPVNDEGYPGFASTDQGLLFFSKE